ncbi:MAG: hypothetical protein WC408_03520 [Candidatus Micrarchaeia archaeon]|jgi:hypothetical protein
MTFDTPKIALFSALFMISFCFFALATPVETAALGYLNSNETDNAKLANFTSEGTVYYMVYNNASELFILKESGSTYSIVTDEAALAEISNDYISFKYGASVAPAKIQQIKAEQERLNNATRNCTNLAKMVLSNSPMMLNIQYADLTGKTYRALIRLTGVNGSKGLNITDVENASYYQNKSGYPKYLVKGYLATTVGMLYEIGNMTQDIDENGSAAENTAKMLAIKKLVGEIKIPLNTYVNDQNYLHATFPPVMKACGITGANYTSFENMLSVSELPSNTALANLLAVSAKARESKFAAANDIASIVETERTAFNLLVSQATAAKTTMKQYGIGIDSLDRRLQEVNDSLKRTINSASIDEATRLDKDFSLKIDSVNNYLAIFSNTTITSLSDVDRALVESQAAITKAKERMGATDTNVNSLNQTWETARLDLIKAKSDLTLGKSEAISTINNQTVNLNKLTASANGAVPASQQLDILLMCAAVLVIIIMAVLIYYTKGRNKKPPVVIAAVGNAPQASKGAGIIVERK